MKVIKICLEALGGKFCMEIKKKTDFLREKFRDLKIKFFARINFREYYQIKYFAGINEFGKQLQNRESFFRERFLI